jgi:hypothetical protein
VTDIQSTLNGILSTLECHFNLSGTEQLISVPDFFMTESYINKVWASDSYRKAQINVIDMRSTHGIWMLHCCVYPHINNNGPIFGFDVFAGKSKITGCFHDFSPTSKQNHEMINWFENATKNTSWNKQRTLPDWALSIFSKNIIAASNVQEELELMQIKNILETTSRYYIENISRYCELTINNTDIQNYYCSQQKQNQHNKRVLVGLGLSEEHAELYISDFLFPEIK